jgi:hypothetical protein
MGSSKLITKISRDKENVNTQNGEAIRVISGEKAFKNLRNTLSKIGKAKETFRGQRSSNMA